jgi:hypothetical protein
MIVRRLLKDEFPSEYLVGVSDDGPDALKAVVGIDRETT